MRERRVLAGVIAGLCVGLAAGWLVWKRDTASSATWTSSLLGSEPVLVIEVETRRSLDIVRRAVSTDRVVASTETGFAVEPQRVVVTSVEFAGELLAMAGWQDRPLEIIEIGRRIREDTSTDTRLSNVASLMNKPTLTRGEAYLLLNSM